MWASSTLPPIYGTTSKPETGDTLSDNSLSPTARMRLKDHQSVSNVENPEAQLHRQLEADGDDDNASDDCPVVGTRDYNHYRRTDTLCYFLLGVSTSYD